VSNLNPIKKALNKSIMPPSSERISLIDSMFRGKIASLKTKKKQIAIIYVQSK
jgi:hypothetical protein